ncbi:TPA: hypothetical protein DCL30_04650 [Candidatus Peribacteria bacterium]|nr:hypothetical protein [Candidatus Peribacteria bacterium]HAS34087.1 hypothetical protein [Candidatus Peribacteria bacterium]
MKNLWIIFGNSQIISTMPPSIERSRKLSLSLSLSLSLLEGVLFLTLGLIVSILTPPISVPHVAATGDLIATTNTKETNRIKPILERMEQRRLWRLNALKLMRERVEQRKQRRLTHMRTTGTTTTPPATTVTSSATPTTHSANATPIASRRRGGGGSGNQTSSTASTAATDNTAPVISSISSGTPGATSVTITWTTDESADSQIDYGATSAYGTTTTLDSTLTTSHSVTISGLTAETLYHFRVRSTDASGNLAVSADQNVTTAEYYGASTAAGAGYDTYASVLSLTASGDDLLIRDAATPANNYSGTPYNKFNEASGPKRIFDAAGLLSEQNYLFRSIPKETFFNVPDGLGGDVGEGFTITGLAYDGENLWAGNDGIAQDGGLVSHPSVVKMTLAGVKIAEYSMETIYDSDGSVQGVTYDTSDDTVWIADNGGGAVRHMTNAGVDIGDGFSLAAVNGLTYDSTRDRLWVLVGDILTRRQKNGTVDYTHDLGIGLWDQLHYDADRDYLWVTEGDNGDAGQLHAFDIASETIVGVATVSDVTAIEGMTIIDGDFYVAHDGYRHAAAVIQNNQVQIYPAVKGAANVAWAIDHDPLNANALLGYLIEPAFSRISSYPTQINQPQWTKSNVSVSADAVVSPTGEQNAETITATIGTGARYFNTGGSTLTVAGTKFATEVFVKAGTHPYVWLGDRGDTGGIHSASFNLNTGTVIGQSNATGTIYSIGNGWYVVSLNYTHNSTASVAVDIAFGAATHSTDRPSATYVGTETLNVFYGGLGAQPFVSSPIFSSDANETRAADVPVLATSEFDLSTTESNTFIWQVRTARGSGSQVLFQIDDGTSNERYRIVRDTHNKVHFVVTDGGVDQCDLNFGIVGNNTAFKIAVRATEDDCTGSLDGAAVVTAAGGTLPTVTTLRVGHSNAGEQWTSTVYAGAIISDGLTDAALQTAATQ